MRRYLASRAQTETFTASSTAVGISTNKAFIKRAVDIFVAGIILFCFWWLILLMAAVARIDTGCSGFFRQQRVGRHGRIFKVTKIRTMRPQSTLETTVTRDGDPRITRVGGFLRKSKLDELPQFWNVLIGDMSLVGPRPDVPSFADTLVGEDRLLLTIRPGITGPATLAFRDEEAMLAKASNPDRYNRDVIYPRKVQMNLDYIRHYSLSKDLHYIWLTIRQ